MKLPKGLKEKSASLNTSDNPPLTKKRSARRFVLPSLVISSFAIQPPGILTGLLLIDIGLTFGCSVGVTGQIQTASSVVAVIFSLLMGALSVRFKHKSLLMTGLVFLTISALGCSFASNFSMMLTSYAITGLVFATVTPMANTLIGEHFPLEKRASAIGWVTAGGSLSYVIGAPVIGFIAGLGGWRSVFLGFVLPISILSLLITAKGLPSTSRSRQPMMNKRNYLEGFKKIFSNTSATACMVGTALSMAGWQAIVLYGPSFFRQRFLVSTVFTSIIILGAALCYTLGSLISGQFVNRFGRKPLTVLATFLLSIFIVSYTNTPNLWLSMALFFLGCLFGGMSRTASYSLALEQLPRFRGTMMSINSAATFMGSALGAGVGGLALLVYDYEFVGIALVVMSLAAAIFYYLLVIDPTRT